RTVGGSSGYVPAVPRTPSVPNNLLFDTGDPHLNRRRFDAGHADSGRRVDADVEGILAGAKPAQIDEGDHVVGHDVRLLAAPQGNVDDRRQRLRVERRRDVSEMDRLIVKDPLE